VITAHAKELIAEGRPLIEQLDEVVDAVVERVVEGVVVIFGVVEVVDEAFVVVDEIVAIDFVVDADVVVVSALFCFAFVQAAVTVTVVYAEVPVPVTVEVTSLMGTKDEQKADALKAIKTALHVSTSPRASKSARGICAAEAAKRRAEKLIEVRSKCIIGYR